MVWSRSEVSSPRYRDWLCKAETSLPPLRWKLAIKPSSSAHCFHYPSCHLRGLLRSTITQLWQQSRTRLFTQATNSLLIRSRNTLVPLLNTTPNPPGMCSSIYDIGKRSALSTRLKRWNYSLNEQEFRFPSLSSVARTMTGLCSWKWVESTASIWVKSARNARSWVVWGITTAANTTNIRILRRLMPSTLSRLFFSPSSQSYVLTKQDWTGLCCRRRRY